MVAKSSSSRSDYSACIKPKGPAFLETSLELVLFIRYLVDKRMCYPAKERAKNT